MQRLYLLCFTLVVFSSSSCKINVLSGKKQMILIPEAVLQSMASEEYQSFLTENKVITSTKSVDVQLVNRVSVNVIDAVKKYYQDAGLTDHLNGFNWEVNLVDDSAANAWCMPGGKIVVHTGLLPISKNDAGLAVIIGHEVSHALLKHGNQRMSQGILQLMGELAVEVAVANKPQETQDLFLGAYGIGTDLGALLPFSRKHELEADRYGLIFAALAGYDPQEAIPLWERMKKASEGEESFEFLSTHPHESKRIRHFQKIMPEALSYYKKT
ncbi:MAG: M48 family metallopeptidase [Sphingomonadales bacterium]|nr:M48 family metallopeptidase [Sphingomonadales bacterium]